MTKTKELRNNINVMIGWCEDVGDSILARHRTKGYCGKYVKATNLTLTPSGKIFCYGDGTDTLIRDKDRGIND